MNQDVKIQFGIDALEEQKYKISPSLPETIDATDLEVRYLVETEILSSIERIKVTTGVKYSVGESDYCELVISAIFGIAPFSDIIVIDEAKKTVSFSRDIVPTLLNITFGALRGALFEKIKDTVLASFPLPIISMPQLVEMNRFRVEKTN